MDNKVLSFIYGAGKYGKYLFQCFRDLIEIDYFVQTEEPVVKEIEGIPVISFERMINMEGKKIVFIAMGNKRIAHAVGTNIYNADSANIKVYYCGDFIADNLLMENKFHLIGDKYCIVCGNSFKEFLPSGIKGKIFDKYHIIGGGRRNNCICPCCGAWDRQRWFYYVLQNKTDIPQMSGRILHFAPEKGVVDYIKQNEGIDYYTADIISGRLCMSQILQIFNIEKALLTML